MRSTRFEETSHLQVTGREGGFFEHPRELGFDDVGRPEAGSLVHDEGFIAGGRSPAVGRDEPRRRRPADARGVDGL